MRPDLGRGEDQAGVDVGHGVTRVVHGEPVRIANAIKFSDARERWLYAVVFAGLILTALGSGYYHLAPDNARLVWDRIPIMITFMAQSPRSCPRRDWRQQQMRKRYAMR